MSDEPTRYTTDLFNINEAERDMIIQWAETCQDSYHNFSVEENLLYGRFVQWKEDRDAARARNDH